MKEKMQTHEKGFTLIEMLLVLVIISMIIYMAVGYIEQRTLQTRMDRTSLQMQQILNAGLAYYVAHGSWPPNPALSNLQGTYLPPSSIPFQSPWGQQYVAVGAQGTPPAQFFVYTNITAGGSTTAAANIIAGKLPLAYTTSAAPSGNSPPASGSACAATATSCYVVASVNIPGQNLNNAPAVNFAGVYNHGGCVPVPTCPVDNTGTTMTPEIMVVPVSVSGVNDPGSPNNYYPISSFTAYATSNTGAGNTPTDTSPPGCTTGGANPSTTPDCTANLQTTGTAAAYWRVCLQVITEKGDVNSTNTDQWGKDVTLMAITRCAIQNEPSGSNFNVFSN